LNRCFPSGCIERALSVGAGRREDAAKRTCAGEQDCKAFDRGDLAHLREAFLAFDDRPAHELAVWIERPQVCLSRYCWSVMPQ